MRKRFLSALLALCMALTLFPATALAGDFGEKRLEGDTLEMYRELRTFIAKIASGEETSTVLEIKGTFASGDTAQNVVNRAGKVVDYLMVDCPAELYWYDKTTGNAQHISYGSSQYTLTVTFYVSKDYSLKDASGNSLNTKIDSAKVTPAKTALTYAQTIVDKYKDVSDFAKLEGYKKEICDLVSYNDAAADESTKPPYGNPWQLIYVFDNDASTDVVCEGYSKAFQYLCDLTTFADSSIVCYTVTGQMAGGTGAGGHMWNIVQIGGKSYLVDITNSDTDSVGQDGGLFMAGTTPRNDGNYQFQAGSQYIVYAYDSQTTNLYNGTNILTLAAQDYTPPAEPTAEWNFTVSANPASIKVGKTSQITVTGADKEGVTLSVNSAIASLNTATGELTANAVGTVTVTATKAADATHKATTKTATVTITEAPAEPVDWNFAVAANPTSIKVGETSTITVTGADKEDVILSVSDTELAEINSNVLTAKKEGTVTVTATKAADETQNKNKTDKTVSVTITKADEPVQPSKVKPVLTVEPNFLMVHVGDTVTKDNFTVTAKDGDTEVQGTWEIVGSVDTSVEGDIKVAIKFTPADSGRYEETTEEITVAVLPSNPEEKELPTVSVNPITVTEGTAITTADIANNGTAVNAAGVVLAGAWEFVDEIPTAVGRHNVVVKFVPEGTDLYKEADTTVVITISEKPDEPTPPPVTPAEPVEPEVSVRDITVVSGTPVTDDFIKGTANVPGTWAFVGTVPTEIGTHTVPVRFTPADTVKYKAVETTLTLNITKRWNDYTRPVISGVSVSVNDRPFNPNISAPSRPGEGSYVLNVEINVNVTLQNLLEQMFSGSVWSGEVYYTSRARAGMPNGLIGYWHGDTRRFDPAPGVDVDVSLADGFFTLAPADPDYAVMTLLVSSYTRVDDSETYYISIPGAAGGEIIPNVRYAAYGERVTLSVHPAKGYKLDSLTVRDVRGREVTLRDAGKDQYAFYMPSCRVEVEAVFTLTDAESAASPSEIPGTNHTAADPNEQPFTGLGTPGISGIVLNPASMPFSDVKGSDWYYNYVEYMWKHYLMSGVSDSEFAPGATTSRAMIWTVMARMNNVRTDINPGSTWYERGMLWAMEQGVTDGTNPMGDITREQLVTMLWRNAGKPGAGIGTLEQFSDAASVSGYAETAVRWAVGAGVLTGDNGRINPQGTATRAQVAAMIARYGDKVA